uniref:Peptidase S8/S53 domain-containing protein n=1 Tax=Tetradesmus obliquus TaxID=3088 RepID=A0A383WNW8_TETOB|eukprot:jgi/Sobl393_1/18803/SZX79111.1
MVGANPASVSRSRPQLVALLLLFLTNLDNIKEVLAAGQPSGHLGTGLRGILATASSSSHLVLHHRTVLSAAATAQAQALEQPGETAAAAAAATAAAAIADDPDDADAGSDVPDLPAAVPAAVACAPVLRLSKGFTAAAAAAASITWPGCSTPSNRLVWMPQRCGSSLQALQYAAVYAISNQTKLLARSSINGAPCVLTRAASSQALTSQLLSPSCGTAPLAARSLPVMVCAAAAADPCFGSTPQASTVTATMRLVTPVRCPSTGELIRLLDYSGKPCGPGSKFTQWFQGTSRSGCRINAASLAAVLRVTSSTPQTAARALELAKASSDVFGSCGVPPALAVALPQNLTCSFAAGPLVGNGNGSGSGSPEMPKTAVKAGGQVAAPLQRIGVGVDGQVADLSRIADEQQVTVAVVDSGIDRTHPDLNVVGGKSWVTASALFSNDTDWGVDYYAHGTQVAGIIAARNNGARFVGISPGAPLFALKVFNGNGKGSWSSIFQAIEWVIAEGRQQYNIRVVNLSLEISPLGNIDPNEPGYTDVYAMACGLMARADAAGVLVVVSAANNGVSLRTSFPAVCQSTAAVTALNYDVSKPLHSSNFLEAAANDTEKAHIFAAPGSNIPTTQPMDYGSQTDDPNDIGTYFISGTSAAAPFVAGVAANCLMSGACAQSSSGSDIISKLQEAARERAVQQPASGFSGDPMTPNADFAGRYYGYLVWSKW